MTIPAIQPYPMPRTTAPNVTGWWPDPTRAALLVHDMQNYFVDFFPAGQAPVVSLLANVARLRDAATAAGVPVVYSAQPGPMTRTERGLLRDVWGDGMTGGREREFASAVAPGPEHLVVPKRRYSAFHGSPLRSVLADLGRDQLLICGVYAHVGVLMTAADAFAHDIEAFLVSDAVADFTEAEHRMALDYAAKRCASTLDTADVIDALRRQPAAAARAGGPGRPGR